MRTNIRLKIDMSEQVVKFCDLHPFDTPAAQEVAAHMKSLVARAEELARQQRAGTVEARASTATKAKLRSDIWDDLLVLRGFADAAALRQPEIPIELQLPDRQVSHQAFLTAARVTVAEARRPSYSKTATRNSRSVEVRLKDQEATV